MICFHNTIQKAWTWIQIDIDIMEDGSVSPCPRDLQFLFSYPARISGQFAKWPAERKPPSLLGNPNRLELPNCSLRGSYCVQKRFVLVCSGCNNKNSIDQVAYKQQIVLEARKSKCQPIWCLVRTCFLIAGWLFTVTSHGRRARELCPASFRRVLMPLLRAPPRDSITFQSPHCLMPSPWGTGFQHMNFGRHNHPV